MNMRRYPIIACLVALVMLGAPSIERVHAYATFGVTWPTNQVPYYVNPANLYVSDAAALTALQGAASAWHDQSGANISLTYAGYTSVTALTLDYKNEVFFRNDTGGSVIAETYWYSSGTTLVDADIVFHEADHVFTTGSYGCSGSQYYVENTGTHEFGHVLGMAHSTVTTATMYPYSDYCETIRETLDPDDIAGIQSLYPPAATPTVPSAPSQLSASVSAANPSSSLSLAWVDTATNATGYQVGRSTDGVTFTTIAQLGSTAASYVDTGLTAGASYCYRVAAFNSAGQSAYSNVATGTTQPPSPTSPQTAPSAPFSPSPANGATGVNPNVTLSWSDSGAQAYDVYLNGTLYAANLTSPSVSVSSLTWATAYSWTITAKNSAGSTTGPAWSFTTRKKGKR
jgi:Matrixin/Fibronectin type III domain